MAYRLADGFYRPAGRVSKADYLELGCCRLEIAKDKKQVAATTTPAPAQEERKRGRTALTGPPAVP